MGRNRRLIKVGRTFVNNAIGFFWHDKTRIYVAKSKKDIDEWKCRGFGDEDLHPMCELEQAFKDSSALRFISWCDVKMGGIVKQGARQVKFEYDTHVSVIHIK